MEGLVYLISETSDRPLYKIGVTKGDVNGRVKQLQTGNGERLNCVHTFRTSKPYKLEKMLHFHFRFNREEGEWFSLDKDDVNNFPMICEKYQGIIDALKDNPFF